jgi:hypothetical protein
VAARKLNFQPHPPRQPGDIAPDHQPPGLAPSRRASGSIDDILSCHECRRMGLVPGCYATDKRRRALMASGRSAAYGVRPTLMLRSLHLVAVNRAFNDHGSSVGACGFFGQNRRLWKTAHRVAPWNRMLR